MRMSAAKGKSLRLSFKGEAPKKRKRSHESSSGSRRHKTGRSHADRGGISDVEDVGGDEQAWVSVESELDLSGPCFIFTRSRLEPHAALHSVAFQPTLQSVEAAAVLPASGLASNDDIATLHASDPRLAEELEGAEIVPSNESLGMDTDTITPQSVYQVWVATKVPGSESPARFTFKSAEGKFLGADKHGTLRASMEARGPQEEWTLKTAAGPSGQRQWMLRSVHGQYLALDQVAGGKTVVRADAERSEASSEDASALWNIKVQWKHRHAARHASGDADAQGLRRTKANDPTALQHNARDQVISQELDTLRSRAGAQYMPSNYGASMSKEERRALRKAQKEGRLAEEMLDRRTKLKSDKYA